MELLFVFSKIAILFQKTGIVRLVSDVRATRRIILLDHKQRQYRRSKTEDAKQYQRNRHKIVRTIQQHFERCGIQTTEAATGDRQTAIVRVGFHSLRHSYISFMANAQGPAEVRRSLAAHDSAAVHEGYTHHDHETLKRAVDSLPTMQGA